MENETLKLICRGCGSSLEYSAGSKALKCMYCDAVTEIEQEESDDGRPATAELVVPLGVTRQALEDLVYAHLAHGDLTPDNLLEHAVFSKVEQFYVPAYFYTGSYEADWTASFGYDRQEHFTVYEKDSQGNTRPVSKTKRVTDWRPVNGADRGTFAVLAYAGQRLSATGLKLTETLVESPSIDEFKPYDSSYASGVGMEDFAANAQEVYTSRASDLVNEKIETGVRQHAQGDHQKDWRWKASTSKTETSVLLPVCHVIYDYEGRTFNVWTDGTTGAKLIADPSPVDTARQNAIRWGYAPALAAMLAAGGAAVTANSHHLDLRPSLIAAVVVASLMFGWLRKQSILSYSRNIRQALLSQRQLKSVDSLSMSAAERQAVLDSSGRPGRPFLSVTSRDAILLPAISLAATALLVVPLAAPLLKTATPSTSTYAATAPVAPRTAVTAPTSVQVAAPAAATNSVALASLSASPVPAATPPIVAPESGSSSKIALDPQLKQALAAATQHQWAALDASTSMPLASPNTTRDRPTARGANAEGRAALQRSDMAAAVEAFTRGTRADSLDPEVVNNLAYALQESGAHAEAIAALNQALRLSPRRTSAWANLSSSLAELGDAQAAQAAMTLALHYSGNRQKTLAFLSDQQQGGRSDVVKQVATAVLAAAADIPTFGDVGDPAVLMRVDTTQPLKPEPLNRAMPPARRVVSASVPPQLNAEEAYARQMNQQLEQQLKELSQK